MKKKYVLLLLIPLLLTGCLGLGKPRVNKKIQRSEDEVISYVTKSLTSKYGNVKVTLKNKDNVYTQYGVCINVCGKNTIVKGAVGYNFIVEDRNGNIAYARYEDGYKKNKEQIDNSFVETYSLILEQGADLRRHSDLISAYFDSKVIKNKHYQVDYGESDFGPTEDFVKIIYELDLSYFNLSYEDYAKINMLGIDVRRVKGNSFSTNDPKVYVEFNDNSTLYELYLYGLNNNSDNEKEKSYTTLNDDSTDYYGIKKYVKENTSDEEINKALKLLNTKAKAYINDVNNIGVSNYGNIYSIVITTKTKNNNKMNIRINFELRDGNYYAEDIKLESEAVIRTWKVEN